MGETKTGRRSYGQRPPSRPPPRADEAAEPVDTAGAAVDPQRSQLPAIWVGTEMESVGQAARAALDDDPDVYQRGGRLVQIAPAPRVKGKWLRNVEGSPSITEWTTTTLRARLSRRATWHVRDARTKRGWKEDVPPEWAARLLIEGGPHTSPVLSGIVEAPALRPDGSLLSVPGYDAPTGLYYVADRAPSVSLPDRPSLDDARSALATLIEPLEEFPFASEVDRIAAVAMLLTTALRVAIPQPCPLFLISGNASGAGKTLLADVAAMMAYGRVAPRMAVANEDAEMRKRITTVALVGSRFVLLDNIGTTFGCPALDAALTSLVWEDRVLGSNRLVTVPLWTVWVATGNNVAIQGDLARRTIPIQLQSDTERPEERPIRRQELLDWVEARRGALLGAAITLVRAWFLAERPPLGLPSDGGFREWSSTIRGALAWASNVDPAAGRAALRDEADPQRDATRGVLREWWRVFSSRIVTAGEILRNGDGDLRMALVMAVGSADGGKSPDPERLGPWLRNRKNVWIDGLVLRRTKGEGKKSTTKWWMESQ